MRSEPTVSYRLNVTAPLDDEFRRIAREQLDRAIRELRDLPRAEAIHQARKRCKKLRALLRLFRPVLGETYGKANAHLRDAAGGMSGQRDATVLVQTHRNLFFATRAKIARKFGGIHAHLVHRRDSITRGRKGPSAKSFRGALQTIRDDVDRWKLDPDSIESVLASERKTYTRGRKAMAAAFDSLDPEALHEWRKRVKYYGHHTRLLRDLWPTVMKAQASEIARLGDILGDDHDLAVLRDTLQADPTFGSAKTLQPFFKIIEARQTELRDTAQTLGHRVHAEKPKHHTKRLRALTQIEGSAGFQPAVAGILPETRNQPAEGGTFPPPTRPPTSARPHPNQPQKTHPP